MNDIHEPPVISEAEMAAYRARQRGRNRVMGLVLGGLAILFFAITMAKLGLKASGQG
ncbi:hypothetical protein ACFO0A_04935 [Novosphingobium tardum]|jgi:hypothetical protein|uniref:Cytochrome C oxidase assembly protein n=1 Tax=Novosphingobium tardum TaxID=1538021 RepID=A0ABV8RQ49_9SPHN